MKPPVLVLHAPGTNRDRDVAEAFRMAGAAVDIAPLSALAEAPARVRDYRLVCVPGGFSYGDALGAGRVFALQLRLVLGEVLREHLARQRPVLGICNGFQALIKAGLIAGDPPKVTLTHNARGHFECRQVTLVPDPRSRSPWITSLSAPITCPVAHGEGRLAGDLATMQALAALRYVPSDSPDGYPGNPNGSPEHLAGLTDETGLVLGLMPHPEDHVHPFQSPAFHAHRGGVPPGSGLPLFRAGVALAAQTS